MKHQEITQISYTTSSECAEALAVQRAVEWAKDIQLEDVHITTDCKNVVNFLENRPSSCDWRAISILKDVTKFCNLSIFSMTEVQR